MQLKSLRIFVTVSETGSFIATAEKLHTVQSNVTAHIKRLEHELGVQLLHRRKNRAVLTSAGQELLAYAEKILRLHDDAAMLFQQRRPKQGQLRIGAMETTMALRLPPILTRFHQSYPYIDIKLQTGPSAELSKQLSEGMIDCAFVAGEVSNPGFTSLKTFQERLVLVASSPLKTLPDRQTLAEATFIAFRQGCSYRHQIEIFLESQGVTSTRIFDFGSLDAILGCVAAGMGMALLPEVTVKAYRDRYKIYEHHLPESLGNMTTYFIAAHEKTWSPALSTFYQTVIAMISQK
jgi:DNA-binding transcriptional LysR family regulator